MALSKIRSSSDVRNFAEHASQHFPDDPHFLAIQLHDLLTPKIHHIVAVLRGLDVPDDGISTDYEHVESSRMKGKRVRKQEEKEETEVEREEKEAEDEEEDERTSGDPDDLQLTLALLRWCRLDVEKSAQGKSTLFVDLLHALEKLQMEEAVNCLKANASTWHKQGMQFQDERCDEMSEGKSTISANRDDNPSSSPSTPSQAELEVSVARDTSQEARKKLKRNLGLPAPVQHSPYGHSSAPAETICESNRPCSSRNTDRSAKPYSGFYAYLYDNLPEDRMTKDEATELMMRVANKWELLTAEEKVKYTDMQEDFQIQGSQTPSMPNAKDDETSSSKSESSKAMDPALKLSLPSTSSAAALVTPSSRSLPEVVTPYRRQNGYQMFMKEEMQKRSLNKGNEVIDRKSLTDKWRALGTVGQNAYHDIAREKNRLGKISQGAVG